MAEELPAVPIVQDLEEIYMYIYIYIYIYYIYFENLIDLGV
jgi:hypothetical protein